MGGGAICTLCGEPYPADLDEVNSQGRYINRSKYAEPCACSGGVPPAEQLVEWVLDADEEEIADSGALIATLLAEDWYEKQRALGRVLVNEEDLNWLIHEAHEVATANYRERVAKLEKAIDRVIDGQYDILNSPTLYVY
jgi:hypothetical protein